MPAWRLEQSREKRAKNERNEFTSCLHVEGRSSGSRATNEQSVPHSHGSLRACPVSAMLRHGRTGARTERRASPSQDRTCRPRRLASPHRKQWRKSLFLIRTGVFDLDRTAAFMYKSRVSMGYVNACCRAVASPCPTVLSSRLRQTERGSPRASCIMRLTLCASTGNVRNSRFGAKF
jgi:hypothetical protein